MDIITVQTVFHLTIAALYLALTVLIVQKIDVSSLAKLLAGFVGFLAALYRFDTAWFVWHADRSDAGFSGTTMALIINANILAFSLGFLLILLAERGRRGRG